MGGNVCKPYVDKRLISRIYKEPTQLNNNKKKNLSFKMSRGPEQKFFQKRHPNRQLVHEKMLNIINHQETQIKTTMRYHLTSVRMAIIKKTRESKCCKNVEKNATIVHWWWESKLVNHYGKQYLASSKKLKIELPYDLAIPFLSTYQKEMRTGY